MRQVEQAYDDSLLFAEKLKERVVKLDHKLTHISSEIAVFEQEIADKTALRHPDVPVLRTQLLFKHKRHAFYLNTKTITEHLLIDVEEAQNFKTLKESMNNVVLLQETVSVERLGKVTEEAQMTLQLLGTLRATMENIVTDDDIDHPLEYEPDLGEAQSEEDEQLQDYIKNIIIEEEIVYEEEEEEEVKPVRTQRKRVNTELVPLLA